MSTIHRPLARSVRRALLAAAALASVVSAPAVRAADDDAGASTLDEVLVTGSRIARPELEAPTPTVVLGREQLDVNGYSNFADIAVSLPQFTPSFGASRTQSTFAGASNSGLNLSNLRNLTAVRSVVLVNGRRVPGGTSTSTSVDFNTLPTANIERVEIITGGASAVYGADAVSGVINIITRKDFEGIELGGSYSLSNESDNENPTGYAMYGIKGDRGRALITAQLDYQGKVSCADRFLCAEDFLWTNPAAAPLRGPAAYSGVGAGGRFFVGNTSYTQRNGSFTDAAGNLIPFSVPVDGYNRNRDRTLAIPTRRVLLAAEGEYQLSDNVTGFAELNYGSAKIESDFEGHPFQSQQPGSLFGGGPGVTGLQATIPIDNPFIPAPLRAAAIAGGVQNMTWWQRLNGLGDRGATTTRQSVRAVLGFKGSIESLGFGNDWSWEVNHVYGKTTVDSISEGLVSSGGLYYGLRVEADPANPGQFRCIDPGARATGCVPINPFDGYNDAERRYLRVTAGQSGNSVLEDSQAYVSGSLFDVPAGPVRAVLGLERRKFSGFLDYDDAINRGLTTGNQIGDVDKATTTTKEVFTEASVPVLRDLPGARMLNVDAAFRYSEPDRGDSYRTWKYGVEWSPVQDVRIRANKARSVRAPVPVELSGIGLTAGVVNDPCTRARRNANATRAANCAADGVPADYAPVAVIEQGVSGLTGGNPNLEPEVADTLTYGVVWTPSFAPGLTVSVDRFQIEIDGIITSVARQLRANKCYDTADRQFCGDLTRGPNPLLPGANYVLLAVNETLDNVAAYNIRGFDVEARYPFDLGKWGTISTQALVTIYDKAEQLALPGDAPTDLLGFAGGSTNDQGFIRRQANANVTYQYDDFAFNWNLRYVGKAGMSPFTTGFPELGSALYHNVRASYAWKGSEFYAGVNNLADKQPPFFCFGCSGTQALDTIPGYYDVFGRTYYGGMRVRF